jgi:hypothetical protein
VEQLDNKGGGRRIVQALSNQMVIATRDVHRLCL